MWKRLIFPTVFVAVCWLLVSGGTTYYINWLNQSYQRVLAENVEANYSSSRIQEAAWKVLADVNSARHEASLPTAVIAPTIESLEREYLKLKRLAFTAPEVELVNELGGQLKAFKSLLESLARESSHADTAARAAQFHQLSDLTRALAASSDRLRTINQQLLLAAGKRRDSASASVFFIRTAVLILGPGLGIAYGWWMANQLQRSVARITVTLRDAAVGERSLGAVCIDDKTDLDHIQTQVELVVGRLNQANDELRRARDEVLRSERLAAVGELAAGVAHELRNPLTSVKLLLQHTAQRSHAEALTDAKLQLILDEIARMESTIQSLLDFSRPPRLNRLRHDVRESLRRAMNLVVGRSQQQHVTVSAELGDLPLIVNADPEQLHQVFVNLLLNGLEAMPQGGHLSLQAGVHHTNQFIEVTVRDTGCGIPDEMLKRLFEPFATSKDRGTGLGLAVSRRIVTDHQGTIEASNEVTGGAVFRVTLPAA
ncbi:MAG: signal transduction histidine kinase, nitrogen specific, NtrB [Planctomycetaceae bacterium]|nr:signal transduction histidine kinase, nitrogen specific, NtrB [Planctomycetaceae bacterium]